MKNSNQKAHFHNVLCLGGAEGMERNMEALARELRCGIDITCGAYYYHKDENVLLKGVALAERIQKFCGAFLQGNIYGMEDAEYQKFQAFVIGVLEDYLEVAKERDLVYMLDTLDHGLRELVDIYEGPKEEGNE